MLSESEGEVRRLRNALDEVVSSAEDLREKTVAPVCQTLTARSYRAMPR